MQLVGEQLGRFKAAAATRGGVVKSDVADIYAVAFILNYEVLNDGGEVPGAGRRRWLAEQFRARPEAREERANVDARLTVAGERHEARAPLPARGREADLDDGRGR